MTFYTRIFSVVFAAMLVMGCTSSSIPAPQAQLSNLLLAEPAPVNPRSEMLIARYSQVLQQPELNDDERAEILYQRGLLYDSVGLVGLAQYDFARAKEFKPDMAAVYNSLGVHLIQQRQFMEAYEEFDSTLDIDPSYDFAFLNRGIALYYGGRPELAVSDLETFIDRDPKDPFRAIWAYFAHYDVDPNMALTKLAEYKQQVAQEHWANVLIDLLLGELSETQLLNQLAVGVNSQRELTYRLCEAYFYLGKHHALMGKRGKALSYFKLALSTNVYEYVEHRYARLELSRLREANKPQASSSSNSNASGEPR